MTVTLKANTLYQCLKINKSKDKDETHHNNLPSVMRMNKDVMNP